MSKTYLTILDPTGTTVMADGLLDYFKLERTRAEMQVGNLVLTLPIKYNSLFMLGNALRTDTQIRIFRSVGDQPNSLDLDTFWFVQEATEVLDASGVESLEVRAVDAIGLLARRVVPYDTTDAQSDKTGQAGDLIKAFVRENFGTLATDTTRDLSSYLTVDVDRGDGILMDYTAQRPIVLTALQEIANSSAEQGSYLSFDIICNPVTNMMVFKTFADYRGNDHRKSSGLPLYIGRDYGNIQDLRLVYSNLEEVNYVYALGGGIGAVKISEERSDSARVLASPFNRKEYVLSCGGELDLDVLDVQGDAYIRSKRPRLSMTCNIQETPQFVYGLHYGFGDYLTLDDKARSFNVRLSALSISDEQGEVIKAALLGDFV
jgi:hypothetical protein